MLLLPIVALAFDVYIFSEDFKVKRVGIFIRNLCENDCESENFWELWLSHHTNREHLASRASQVLTGIVLAICLIVLLVTGFSINSSGGLKIIQTFSFYYFILVWFIVNLIFVYSVFKMARKRRDDMLRQTKEESMKMIECMRSTTKMKDAN